MWKEGNEMYITLRYFYIIIDTKSRGLGLGLDMVPL